jgi:hypothetical protein
VAITPLGDLAHGQSIAFDPTERVAD